MAKVAFIYPGQGAQFVGMGKDIYDNFHIAKNVFHQAEEALSYKLSNLIFHGTEEELKKTEYTQPALAIVSIAMIQVILHETNKNIKDIVDVMAGHSLGEYVALQASNCLSIKDTISLLNVRGQAMAQDGKKTQGAMIAVLGSDRKYIDSLIQNLTEKQKAVICVANDNCPGQIVLSGDKKIIDYVIENYQQLQLKKVIKLNVSGAFHSPLLENTQHKLQTALQNVTLQKPQVDVIANCNLNIYKNENDIKQWLPKQVVKPVRWRETLEKMQQMKITDFVEVGAGKVLSGLVKKTVDQNNIVIDNINNLDTIKVYIDKINRR